MSKAKPVPEGDHSLIPYLCVDVAKALDFRVVERAVAAGAKLLRPAKNHFHGDQSGAGEDPFGHTWHVATHIEGLTPDEIRSHTPQQSGQE